MKKLNVLISYAYWDNKLKKSPLLKSKHSDIFLDSGAYSVHNSNGKIKITIDDYIYFLKHNSHLFWNYINLDVIGDADQSEHNYQKMLAAGLKPVPVFTRQVGITAKERQKRLDKMCEKTDLICIGGLDKHRDTRDYVFALSRHLKKKKKNFHLLGVGRTSMLQAIRPFSSDSSASGVINAWAQMRLFFNGKMYWFGRRGKKRLNSSQMKVLNFYRIPPITVLNEEVFSPENTTLRRKANIRSMLYWGQYIENSFQTKYFQALGEIDLYQEVIREYFPKYLQEFSCQK